MFENGLESPLFHSNNCSATEISSVRLPESGSDRIVGISVWGGNLFTYKIQLELDSQQMQKRVIVVYHLNKNDGEHQMRTVPLNHSIVGVYGKLDHGGYLEYLGFILMEDN